MLGRDNIAKYVEQRGLGPIEDRVRLRGVVPLDEWGRAAVELCLLPSGIFVVGASSATVGTARNLLAISDKRLVSGRLHSDLHVEGHHLVIPPGRRQKVERLLAFGRLREGRPQPKVPTLSGVLIDAPTEVEAAWLANALAPEETVLAWARTPATRSLQSWLGELVTAQVRVVLTVDRFQRVVLSHLGDALVEDLDPQRIRVEESAGRVRWADGTEEVLKSRRLALTLRRVLAAANKDSGARVLEVARLHFMSGEPAHLTTCRALIARARQHGEPRALFAEWMVIHEKPALAGRSPDLAAGLAELSEARAPDEALVELYRDWEFEPSTGRMLVAGLRAFSTAAEPWARELHFYLHHATQTKESDPIESVRGDLALAGHLLDTNERERARELLESRLRRLPQETLAEVLPPRDADLTRGAGGQTLRTRIFELLATARSEGPDPNVDAIAELARLHPLVAERVRRLTSLADADLGRRASAVLSLLEPSGAGFGGELPPLEPVVRPLSDKLIDEVLRHPASRADSPLLARLQKLLAAAPKPDVSMLRDYCEELNERAYPEAVAALRHASRALGTRVRAYVSRGAKGVGLRAYEDDTPFILIGGQHLIEGDFKMTRAELQFAIAAELAHLRFGHVRVTSNEVWAGALEKGQQGLDMALGVLPILRGWKFADQAVRMTSRLPLPVVRRVLGTTGLLSAQRMRPAAAQNEDVLTTLNEQLLVAHRVMQLSADRAGLILAQDIRPAVRAMLLIRRDFRVEIPSMQRWGLAHMLGTRAEDGLMAYQDLAVRISALLSFYLSDEFARLRAALYE